MSSSHMHCLILSANKKPAIRQVFEHDGKTFWYEHAWEIWRGLHEYTDFEAAISDIREKFIDNMLDGEYDPQNLVIYEYDAPMKNLSCLEFYKHCEKGKQIHFN